MTRHFCGRYAPFRAVPRCDLGPRAAHQTTGSDETYQIWSTSPIILEALLHEGSTTTSCLNRSELKFNDSAFENQSVGTRGLGKGMVKFILCSFVAGVVMVAQSAVAFRDLTYEGVATNARGQVLYIEKHKAEFSATGKVLRATTNYVRANGELIGVMKSDFRKAVTAPDYLFRDLRNGSEHGIRLTEKEIILYQRDREGQEYQKAYRPSEFDEGVLLVGCQGLHYYLIDHLEEVRRREKIPIKFLIPGKLDYYSFIMYYQGENNGIVKLKIQVGNLFLRLFVPALEVHYRKSDRKLLKYFGVSNLLDDKGGLQKVSIEYNY